MGRHKQKDASRRELMSLIPYEQPKDPRERIPYWRMTLAEKKAVFAAIRRDAVEAAGKFGRNRDIASTVIDRLLQGRM